MIYVEISFCLSFYVATKFIIRNVNKYINVLLFYFYVFLSLSYNNRISEKEENIFFYMAYRIRIVSDTFRFVLLFFMLFDLVKVKVKIINQIIYFIFMCQLL